MATEIVKPRPRLPGDQRRALIVLNAVELFSRRGFSGTTTRELAMASGITEPVLYQHFETKRALYEAMLEAKTNEFDPRLEEELHTPSASGDNRAYFTKVANLLLDWYLNDPRYVRLLMFSSLEGGELAQLFYERHVAVFYQELTRHLSSQMAEGVLRERDPLVVARTFVGMIAHHGLIFAVYQPGELAAAREEIVATTIDLFLSGLAAQGGRQ